MRLCVSRAGEEFGEVAKLLSDDPGSANNGGEMGWTSPGTFVPEFEEVVNRTGTRCYVRAVPQQVWLARR